MHKIYAVVIMSFLVCGTLVLPVQAKFSMKSLLIQTTTGTLMGVVIDPQNAPVVSAVVRVTNITNGLTRSARTDSTGVYRFDLVPPGLYNIQASAEGYRPNSIQNFVVEINREKVIKPPPIQLLPVSTPVPTIASTPVAPNSTTPGTLQANTGDSTLRGNADANFITALPLAGVRSFDIFALLVPGVFPPPATYGANGPGLGPGVGTAGQFSVNGQRARANNFTIDGSDNNDQDVGVRRQGFTSPISQSIESITEFQISTLLADAESGRNTGGQVNVVSKSGGNEFHGGIYDFLTDSSLNARDFFDLTGGPSEKKNPFTRNQMGFTVGGPIIKDRLHFFGTFEKQNINRAQETHFAVPSEVQRAAAFKFGKRNLNGQLLGRDVLNLYPSSNNLGGPYGSNTFTQVIPNSADGVIFSGKLDYQFLLFGKNTTFASRYNFTDDSALIPSVGGAINSSVKSKTRTQSTGFELDTQVSDRDYNQIRFSYGRTSLSFDEVPGSPFIFQSATTNIDQTGDGKPDGRTGPIGRLVVSPFSSIGVDPFTFPQGRSNNTFQVADTFIMTRGRNTLKFGTDVRRVQFNSFLDRNYRPQLTFSSGFLFPETGGVEIGSGADFAGVGVQSDFLQALAVTPNSHLGLRFWEMNFFAHDSFRIHPHVTIEFGIRYERNTVPVDVNSKIERTLRLGKSDFSVDNKDRDFALGFLNALGAQSKFLDGRKKIYSGDNNNFAPRVGLAWDITGNGRTSLRAGYGIFYDPILGNVVSQSRNVFPDFVPINFGAGVSAPDKLSGNPAFIAFGTDGNIRLIQPGTLNTLGIPSNQLASSLGQLLGVKGFGLGFTLPNKNLPTPYVHQYGVSLEHEFFDRYVASLSYVGTRGRNLIRFRTPNGGSATPIGLLSNGPGQGVVILPLLGKDPRGLGRLRPQVDLGPFTTFEDSATSQYNALQASLVREFSNGLGFQASYTYSHAIDDVSDVFDLAGSSALAQDELGGKAGLKSERGNAGFDVRHRFTLGWRYELPFLQRYKYLKGFNFSGIVTLQTGQPFTVNSSIDSNLDGNLTDRLDSENGLIILDGGQSRIKLAPGVNPISLLAFDPRNIKDPASGRVGRNTFRAAGVASFDMAVDKQFAFRESQNIMLRMEVFNLFNRTHFGVPVRILEAPSFGSSVNTSISSRTIQFALRYIF